MLRAVIKKIMNKFGYELRLINLEYENLKNSFPVEFSKDEVELVRYVIDNGLTGVSKERLFATLMSCKYVLNCEIPGDFVECGVWRGGNAIIAAGIFKMYGSNKKVYLFDTFTGMTEPSSSDVEMHSNITAQELLNHRKKAQLSQGRSIDDVRDNFAKYDLLNENILFIKGDVLQTLHDSENIPESISVLRLDTDWYESTKFEMDILYSRVTKNGVLMIDDYGHWTGSKKAVDEYFQENHNHIFLQYIDYTGRLGVKTV